MLTKTSIKYQPAIICLMGTTASGKTELAITLSKNFSVDIVSVDSALVYREMNIGTAKPTVEELIIAPHQLIDICDPCEFYSVSDFCHDAYCAIKRITCVNRIPLLVGGSMLYFKALLEGLSFLPPKNDIVRKNIMCDAKLLGWMTLYNKLKEIDPIAASKIHYNDHKRLLRALEVFYVSKKTLTELTMVSTQNLLVDYSIYLFAIPPVDRMILHKRIENRFYYMLEIGFEEEVRKLFSRVDLHRDSPSISCIGYRQMWLYLSDQINYHEMIFRCICATRQLARHQITWLRKWSNIYWLDSKSNIYGWVDEINRVVNLDRVVI
ncbi:tRNA (adenosine(37)-N6)-dimethylallyltransferase MiaA [Blochmannia endosymbiont of Polyrhachis (Hedomyrma) turneri]|uniref:tRNA (adenosine(37)-N6)-dimethylallyltransferase MiaA n=1 Tax=Blochmannia endosymbiont of Polyrhachis (Hedomyrma) turneri TaxID=1505596 RepID=UPI00061A6CC7|nr:tRNA (adenosine(37)-N6)-dimethylallyltransferase MiaA [Blochmannia endosymbiont of Polyrhachis (Hedomyrma) turneri]AKC59666.1 tRNA dimethylallyltransferase [Blochmannia endosymbiont of Polyrhachis (Hedomyrma) turneri]